VAKILGFRKKNRKGTRLTIFVPNLMLLHEFEPNSSNSDLTASTAFYEKKKDIHFALRFLYERKIEQIVFHKKDILQKL